MKSTLIVILVLLTAGILVLGLHSCDRDSGPEIISELTVGIRSIVHPGGKDPWIFEANGAVIFHPNPRKAARQVKTINKNYGVALYVYTKGNNFPIYCLQYEGEGDVSTRYSYCDGMVRSESPEEPNLFSASWVLRPLWFGDQHYNDHLYEAIAVFGPVSVLNKLIKFTQIEDLSHLPIEIKENVVFSKPVEVRRD